ncbi:MAG: hypothetical protein LBE86_05040 [Gemmobacter sp.]|jgi:hypothetical protein|nr:hypothetical protein [Gemmobacter sp.]
MIPARPIRHLQLRFALVVLVLVTVLAGLALSALPGQLDAGACRMSLSDGAHRSCGL